MPKKTKATTATKPENQATMSTLTDRKQCCWNCGSGAMKHIGEGNGSYYQCQDCKATYC